MRTRFENVSVKSLTHIDAPERVTSAELEARLAPTFSRLGMRPGVLEGVAGIKARRMWGAEVKPSEAAAEAGRLALARSGLPASAIGALVNTSVCRDFLEPSTASHVHRRLELSPMCLNLDLGNACLGFINGMDFVGRMIERGEIEYGLVVDGENAREVVEATIARLNGEDVTEAQVREQFATLTLGSGAAAMVLCRRDLAPRAPRYLGGVGLTATEHAGLCEGHAHFMRTDTKRLLAEGVALAGRVWARAQAELGWSAAALDHLVMHQVSQVHTLTLGRALGLPLEKAFSTFDELGNIGPAAVPITLSRASVARAFAPGDRVALMAIGSGLSCEMSEIEWGEEGC
ncbi:MAG: 3-oxoacyl-ACP synthase III [Deltaproteobacteria bacterium]|nr:3-oxoacyl-ACP synthase III [Deltaproteobacteria bacterium]